MKGFEDAILQMQQKDESGLNYIYSQTYNFVYLRAKSILKNEEVIRQLMQEVYVALFQDAREVTVENLYEWIGTKVYQLGCSKVRKRKEREVSVLEIAAKELDDPLGENADKRISVVETVLEQLPDLYQATVFAFYYDYMKIEAIAEMMECTPGVIVNRLNYTRKYILKSMEHLQESHPSDGIEPMFSIELMCQALQHWAVEHCLGIMSAQNVYHSICKELHLQGRIVALNGKEFAGVKKTLVHYKSDDRRLLIEEIRAYRKGMKMDKKKMTYLIGGGCLLLLFAISLAFAFRNPKKPDKTLNEQKVEQGEKPEQDVIDVPDADEPVADEPAVDAPAVDTPTQDTPVSSEPTDQPAADTPDVQPAASEYIFPNSATTALTREEIKQRTKEEMRYGRNEIYARHGVIFGVEDLDNYFKTKSWYTPTMSLDDFFANVEMSLVEEENITLIREVESGM